MRNMFSNDRLYSYAPTCNLEYLDTRSCTDMQYMFCQASTNYDYEHMNFDTSNVTSMERMFSNITGYQDVKFNVSSFDTSKCTNFQSMFGYNYGMTELDVSNFNFESVSDYGLRDFVIYSSRLSDDSLHSIIKALRTVPESNANKRLSYIGIGSSNATKCTTFDEWQELVVKGWTTGY